MPVFTAPIAPTDETFCDFCHAPGPRLVSYPCRPFEIQFIHRGDVVLVRQCVCCPSAYRPDPRDRILVSHVSLDAWGACAPCAALLDRAALDPLARRMIAGVVGPDVSLAHRPLVARQVVATTRAFWRHRSPVN